MEQMNMSFTQVFGLIFAFCYFYQVIYIFVSIFGRREKTSQPVPLNRFAVLVCARNEEKVIVNLIKSIKCQTYPREYTDFFVMADNCTDNTATVASENGAFVYTRHSRTQKGKGYALDALLKNISRDCCDRYDAYIVLDADNILKENYIEEINKKLSEGCEIITSYRNSTNYDSNFISAGYALWFLRESRYLNNAREILGTSCTVSGTGFVFTKAIAEELKGWNYHTLTEDVEFSMDMIAKGRRIAYCESAELYDEQPVDFFQSFTQRLRWSRGYLQDLKLHGLKLMKGAFLGNFSCFDVLMNITPAFILTVTSVISYMAMLMLAFIYKSGLTDIISSLLTVTANSYLTLFLTGMITTITEWKHINTSAVKKIMYMFTFPLFMFTYIPVTMISLFVKPEWKQIVHTGNRGKYKIQQKLNKS